MTPFASRRYIQMVDAIDEARREGLGPAERILQALLTYTDHMIHNRPGMVTPDRRTTVGVRWEPVTHKVNEDGTKTVQKLVKQGKKTLKVDVGTLQEDNSITDAAGQKVAEYRKPGLFPEVAAWMYRQVAEVYDLDQEFAARWASYAFVREHRDLKVVLSAFMLVQARKGDPIVEDGKLLFHDEDYRDVGEAMFLILGKGHAQMEPKLLLRVHDLLSLPEIAEINRNLGFGHSARNPVMGRWRDAVKTWLAYRENNPQLLEGLVKAGWRRTVIALAQRSRYKPQTPKFFQTLRWKQKQAQDGRRTLAIGEEVEAAESWDGLTEEQVCEKIVAEKPSYKRIVSLAPNGVTRAIMAAAIEAETLSNKDLVIQTPTLEALGLLEVKEIRERWETAVKKAEDLRAANIASRVKSKATQEKLQEGADKAAQKVVEEVLGDIRVYVIVDVSASMDGALEKAMEYSQKFLQAFPLDRLHVSVFNTIGREVRIQHASKAGVQQAFRGLRAGGGTNYGAGVRILGTNKPQDGETALFFFIGDEANSGNPDFSQAFRDVGITPAAFALLPVVSYQRGQCVRLTAARLGIPCFEVDETTFDDVYAIPRTLHNLIAATPVQAGVINKARPRETLVDTILKTDLLKKPVWAATA
jgi:hypothetical protein